MKTSARFHSTPAAGEGKRGSDGHIAYLLRQAQGAVRQALDQALAKAGLTSPQYLVLNLLDAYAGASGADLARIAHLTPQTINGIVKNLLRDGLITRTDHETHGRVLRTQLTRAGKARLAQCKHHADAIEEKISALLDAKSEQLVRRWLVDVAVTVAAPESASPQHGRR